MVHLAQDWFQWFFSHQYGNTETLQGYDHSVMTLSTELFGFINHLLY